MSQELVITGPTGNSPQGRFTRPTLFAPDQATARRVPEFFTAISATPHPSRLCQDGSRLHT